MTGPIPNAGPFCVYTLLIGDYESLNEQPVARASKVPFICLTDNPSLTSDSWTVVVVPTAFPMDPIRSQRLLKICPHRVAALDGFDRSLYLDNSVVLRQRPEDFIDELPMASGLGLPGHSHRHSVHDEFIEVARLGFDDQGRIFEQLHHYLSAGDPALDEPPHWTALLLRDHRNALVQRTMEAWAMHVLRYSRRDQLSFNTALRTTGLVPERWALDNHESVFHSWPHTPGRQRFAGTRDPGTALMPLPTQLAKARGDLARALGALDAARHESSRLLEGLAASTRHAEDSSMRANEACARADQATRHLADVAQGHGDAMRAAGEQIRYLEQRLAGAEEETRTTLAALRASTSWRVTAPLRQIKRWLT